MFRDKTQRISLLVVSLMVLSVITPVLGWTRVNWSFSYAPSSPIVNQQVTFTTSCYGTPPCTYSWSLGDGSISTNGPTVYHTYSAVGSYTVTVNGQDSADTAGSSSQTIQVNYCQVNTGFSYAPSSPLVGQTVTYTANIAPYPPCSISWSFGDGTGDSSNSQVVYHAYLAAGTYTVTLHATDYNGNVLPPNSQPLTATCGTLASGTAIPVSGDAVNPIVSTAFNSNLGRITSDVKVDHGESSACHGTVFGGTKPGIYIGLEASLTDSARNINCNGITQNCTLYNLQYLKMSAKITDSSGTVFSPNPTNGVGGITASIWDSPHDTGDQDLLNILTDIESYVVSTFTHIPIPPTIRLPQNL